VLFARGILGYSPLQEMEKLIGRSRQVGISIGPIKQHVSQMLCEHSVTAPSLSLARELSRPARNDRRQAWPGSGELFERLFKGFC